MSAIETSVSPILSSLSTGTTSTNNVNTNTLNNAKDKSSLSSQIAQNASHITSTSSNSSSPSTHNNSSSLSAASYNNIGNSSSNSTLSSSPKDISNHRNNVSNQSSPEAQCGVNNYSSASLYVGDLHNDVSEAMLYDVFNSVGPVASIRVCRDATSRKSLGYAYVNYHLPSDAERALDTLNYTLIKGIAVRIMWSQRDPALRKSGTGNVFVKNLDKTIDNKALYDTFSLFGNILSCKVKNDEAGRSLGFGFVHYESDEAAQNAIDRVNGMLIGGKTVFVGRFLKKSQRGGLNSTVQDTPKFTNIYIKNIPQSWNENKLKEIFSAYGKVTSMAMRLDGKNRKFGFINFEDFDEAKNAIDALNNILVDDNGILEEDEQVEEEKSKEQNGVHKEETNEEKKEKEEKGDDDNNNKDKDDNNKDKDDGNNKDKDKDDEKKEKKEKEKIRLFVCPHQSKVQRVAMLKAKYENPHNSINYDSTNYNKKNNKFQGVNLYIKNLDDTINDIELRRLFEVYGTITSAKVMRDEKV